MNMSRIKIAWTTILFLSILMLVLSGCVGLFIKEYGVAARDDKTVRKDGQAVFISENTPSISQGFRPAPLDGPLTRTTSGHNGIDIIGQSGAPVLACASGTVIDAFFDIFYGHRVDIDHGQDKNGRTVRSNYFHLQTRLVEKGHKIRRGQQIGTLGRTGLLAGFPHLHFEIRTADPLDPAIFEPVNPHRFWVNGIGVITCYDSTRQWPDTPFGTTYPVPCLGVDFQ